MSLDVATGTFNIGTGGIGTTVSVTGLSFQPKVVIFSWSGRTAVGQAEATHQMGMGYMISATDRGGATSRSNHSVAAAVSDNEVYSNAAILLMASGGGTDGAADFDAFLSNGFRLVIDDVFAASYLINYLAIGGVDLTDMVSTTVTEPLATGNQDINVGVALDTGLDDKCVLFFGGGAIAINTSTNSSYWGVGVAAGNTPVNATLAAGSDDGAATMVTMSYCRAGECLAEVESDIVSSRGSVTTWLSNGFRINWAEVNGGALVWRALVLKGGRYQVGDALTSTGTTNQVEATTYVPKGLIVASHNKAQSTVDVVQAHDERSIGFATSSTTRNYVSIIDKDAVGTSDVGVAQNTDEMYANQSTAATIVIEGLMDLVSFDASPIEFTYVMDDADPTANFFYYLLFADVPAVVATPPNSLMLMGVGI